MLQTLFAACIGMAVSAAYIPSVTANCTPNVSCNEMDTQWRIIIGIGVIPAALPRSCFGVPPLC